MAIKRQASPDGDEIIVQRPSKLHRSAKAQHVPVTTAHSIHDAKSRTRKLRNAATHTRGDLQPDQELVIEQKSQTKAQGEDVRHNDARKQRSLKRSRDTDNEATTPKQKRHRHEMPPSPMETPSRGATKLFDRLQLHASGTPIKMPLGGYQTPPATPEGHEQDYLDVLPGVLIELVSLYTAIANAISAQLASNVSASRIAVGDLLHVATATWSRRTVELNDLLRVLPIARESGLAFALEDFGRAGVFLVQDNAAEAFSRNTTILDTTRLRKDFEVVLRTKWHQSTQFKSNEPSVFLKNLPLSPVPANDSVQKAEPLFSRGKQRLADLKDSQAIASAARSKDAVAATSRNRDSNVRERGSSLLDRIVAKQTLAAGMPAGPTKEQLERKSALHRVEEVARVLEVLAAGRARASFSLQSVVQQLQQSMRSPMSRTEAETCLSLMAEEITPSFISTINSGSVSGVVITRGGRLGIADLKKKLADAGI